jgi:hypothetical protein
VTPLRQFGLWFAEPDLPPRPTSVHEVRATMNAAKRAWLNELLAEAKHV